jgi:hypothetical protein
MPKVLRQVKGKMQGRQDDSVRKCRDKELEKAQQKKERRLELLARMWLECDPNRGDTDPDSLHEFANGEKKPYWHWFLPRAEQSLSYLTKHNLLKL